MGDSEVRQVTSQSKQREKSLKAHAPRTYTYPTQPTKLQEPSLASSQSARSAGRPLWQTPLLALCTRGVILELERELELLKSQMAQKLMLWGEVGAHAWRV